MTYLIYIRYYYQLINDQIFKIYLSIKEQNIMNAHPQQIQKCRKGYEHEGQPIIMVCLQKNCTRKRLCCLACIDELHSKHEIISLRKFENYLYNTLNHNALTKNKNQFLERIEKIKVNIRDCIEKAREGFNKRIDQILYKSDAHFAYIQGSFTDENFKNINEELYSEFTDEKIQEFFKLAKKSQSNMVSSLEEVTKGIANIEKVFSDKLLAYIKDMDKHNESIIKAIEQFKITTKSLVNKIHFNPDTKSACLVLEGQNTKAKRGQGTGGYPIALVNQPFTQENNSVSFTIEEQPANKGIWMGVCVLDIVKNFNYQSCYGLGKGTWAIDQVGQNHVNAYSWSHHDPNYNSAPKVGWQFAIGDIITIKVDFQKSIVRFTKNANLHYEQPIKLDLGPIYAFAGPTNLNDVISIV